MDELTLSLATTEQIIDELKKRPLVFALVIADDWPHPKRQLELEYSKDIYVAGQMLGSAWHYLAYCHGELSGEAEE